MIIDHLEARWESLDFGYVGAAAEVRNESRVEQLWSVVSLITGTQAPAPDSCVVHSPLLLPAIVGPANTPTLVWDSGLGSVLRWLTLPISCDQPRAVTESILRRVAAIRLALSGLFREATNQANEASSVLRATPIRRTHLEVSDAESRMEDWLLLELQERFAIAHELAHCLKRIDPICWSRFEASLEAGPALRGQSIHEGQDDRPPVHASFVDEWAWYFRRSRELDDLRGGASGVQARRGATAQEELPAGRLREEVACDLLAASVVALFADRRQGGWTADLGVSCSALALANLATIAAIESRVVGASERSEVNGSPTDRLALLRSHGPYVISGTLSTLGRSAVESTEVEKVIDYVLELHYHHVMRRLRHMTWILPPRGPELCRNEILAGVGFMHLPTELFLHRVN